MSCLKICIQIPRMRLEIQGSYSYQMAKLQRGSWPMSGDDGSHLSYLLMAKSRIKRTTKLSTPRRAVLSKRWRVPIEKEVVYIHLVDSENIVNMLQKTSYRF